MSRTPRLFVLSGPSGAGKGTLVARMVERRPLLHLAVSATTRKPRPGEVDGVSYHFLSDERFSQLVDDDGFLEWAEVFEHRYGTLRSETDERLEHGESVMLEIDIQGGLKVRSLRPDAVLIFVEPPSLEELERRLRGRGTEDEHALSVRLQKASYEMEIGAQYDERIVNDDLDEATERLMALMDRYENDGGAC